METTLTTHQGKYRENLAKVSTIIREIFTIHALYIVLVLVGFGLICLL